MPLPNPSFEPESHRWPPGAVAPNREVSSQICTILGQKQPFFAQKSPKTRAKRPKGRETVATPHLQYHFPVSKSPLVPFNSTICPRNGPKRRPKAPKFLQCAPTPRNQARAVSWAMWLKTELRGHLFHPQPPTFCGFQASESRNKAYTPVLVVTWWSRRAAPPAHGWGQRWVHRGPRGKKSHFSQSCS